MVTLETTHYILGAGVLVAAAGVYVAFKHGHDEDTTSSPSKIMRVTGQVARARTSRKPAERAPHA